MINETRPEHFQNNSVIGRFLSRIHLDSLLLAGLILLSLLSCLILYSTSGQHLETLLRQTTRIAIAFFIMLFIAQIPPNQIKRYAVNLYIIGILMLLAVLIIGEMGKGAQRWLDLGLFRFQPSEMIKITTPAAIAWYFSEHALPPRWKELFIALLLIAIPTFLIAKQPDLGTALLIASSGA
ncbi:MAG: FtsW/RodA/SpoVE family cell cycle protein, partial [Methylococcales bacterium]|nr:FtsW/RodA/SpoVE family cell cycle protein [Methylococcales bacterium]